MAILELNLENMKALEFGTVGQAFQQHLKRAVDDCLSRPGDKRVRQIILVLSIAPVLLISGNEASCDGARGLAKIRSKIPDHETQTLDFGVQKGGRLFFNEDSPDNVRQSTLLEE